MIPDWLVVPILAFLFACWLSLGALLGLNLAYRGRRARRISTVMIVVTAPLFFASILDSTYGPLTGLGYVALTFSLAWRGRIWLEDRELARLRSLRVARRRARTQRVRGSARPAGDS